MLGETIDTSQDGKLWPSLDPAQTTIVSNDKTTIKPNISLRLNLQKSIFIFSLFVAIWQCGEDYHYKLVSVGIVTNGLDNASYGNIMKYNCPADQLL